MNCLSKNFEIIIFAKENVFDCESFFKNKNICSILTYAYHDNHYHIMLSLNQIANKDIVVRMVVKQLLDFDDFDVSIHCEIARCSHISFVEFLIRCNCKPIVLHRLYGIRLLKAKFPSTCIVKKIKK